MPRKSQSLRNLITGLGLFVAVIFSAGGLALETAHHDVCPGGGEGARGRHPRHQPSAALCWWCFCAGGAALACRRGILGIGLAGLNCSLTSFSASNQDTFTDVTFHFRFGLGIAIKSLIFAMIMGLLGGFSPAWRASRLSIVSATRGG